MISINTLLLRASARLFSNSRLHRPPIWVQPPTRLFEPHRIARTSIPVPPFFSYLAIREKRRQHLQLWLFEELHGSIQPPLLPARVIVSVTAT